jgi:hypothetical protein
MPGSDFSSDGLVWHKSSYSTNCGNCVEVAELPGGGAAVRDSKDPGGHVLKFTASEWSAFIYGAIAGEFTFQEPRSHHSAEGRSYGRAARGVSGLVAALITQVRSCVKRWNTLIDLSVLAAVLDPILAALRLVQAKFGRLVGDIGQSFCEYQCSTMWSGLILG